MSVGNEPERERWCAVVPQPFLVTLSSQLYKALSTYGVDSPAGSLPQRLALGGAVQYGPRSMRLR